LVQKSVVNKKIKKLKTRHLAIDARRLADGVPAVVGLVGVAGQAAHVAVLVADVVVVLLRPVFTTLVRP
jgi:uncharacterized membrane protein YtjA (UPF0391 family)